MEFGFCCPKCGEPLKLQGGSMLCKNGHCYDISKSGYVNLLPPNAKKSADPGDNSDMIKARADIMAAGYYKELCTKISEIIKTEKAHTVLDAGCGEGTISAAAVSTGAVVLGTDISRAAITRASKAVKGVRFAVAASNALPVADGVAEVVICAFAPIFPEEIFRVLSSKGHFIHVIPNAKHLFNLKTLLYKTPYENEIDDGNIDGFELKNQFEIKDGYYAEGDGLIELVKMTPYYYRTQKGAVEALVKKGGLTAELDFLVRVYSKIEI